MNIMLFSGVSMFVLVWIFVLVDLVESKQSFSILQTVVNATLCAVDQPSLMLFNLTRSSIICIPAVALCAEKCSLDLSCVGFNTKNSPDQCELYRYQPINYAVQTSCSYFTVTKLLH